MHLMISATCDFVNRSRWYSSPMLPSLRNSMVLLALFVASVVLANWLTSHFGLVPVGFGLVATAGTFTAGLALVVRDYLQDSGGLLMVALGIILGGLVSWIVAGPMIALASATAFVVGETVDGFVYTPLRERRWRTAVIGSSIVGSLVDTILFIGLAFGFSAVTWNALAGQSLVKVLYVAVPIALIGGIVRKRDLSLG